MPAPFDYNIQRPDVMGAIGAYEAGRDRNRQVMQQGKQDMFAQYLPGALKGNQADIDQASQYGTPDQQIQLSKIGPERMKQALDQSNAIAEIIGSVPDGDAQGFEAAKQRAIAMGLPVDALGKLTVADLPRLKSQSGQTLRELQIEAARMGLDVSRANIRQSDAAAAASRRSGSGLGGMNNTTFDNISGLRKEYINATKDFGTVADAYSRIKATSAAATPAGDLSMIYAYMKMLDPGSVVRESEFALAGNAKPLIDRMGLSWDAVKSTWEGTKLQPQVRADFLKQAAALYGQQVEQKGLIDGQYTDLSRDFGFDPKFVVTGRAGQTPPPAATDLPPPPPGARIMP